MLNQKRIITIKESIEEKDQKKDEKKKSENKKRETIEMKKISLIEQHTTTKKS